jgi:hypothetical protein
MPGFSAGYATTSFPPFSDTLLKSVWLGRSRRCLRVNRLGTTDSARIAVATPKAVWLFNPGTSAWDTLASRLAAAPPAYEFLDVQVNNRVAPPAIYAAVAAGADTAVYRYDSVAGQWSKLYVRDPDAAPKTVRSIAFGRGGMVYVADEKLIFAYDDTNGAAHLPFSAAKPGSSSFTARLYKATTDIDFTTLTIGGIAALTSPADTMLRLWVATNLGVFYSRNETAGEQTDSAFIFVKRAPKVDAGLKTTYAFPGILVLRDPTVVPKTTFAYNLSKDAKVTIRVYDWNMDLVRTVIDKQPRHAGNSRQSGRSTELQDTWDGTNRDGVIVAPGVYYYVISTDTGVRSRGKIVVALSSR